MKSLSDRQEAPLTGWQQQWQIAQQQGGVATKVPGVAGAPGWQM
jgi:hypothetical protein